MQEIMAYVDAKKAGCRPPAFPPSQLSNLELLRVFVGNRQGAGIQG